MLQKTFLYMSFSENTYIFLLRNMRSKSLESWLILSKIPSVFTPTYTSIYYWLFFSLQLFWWKEIGIYLIMVWIFIHLMSNNIVHLFICLLAIGQLFFLWLLYPVNGSCLYLNLGVLPFSYWFVGVLFILYICLVYRLNSFSYSVASLFIFLMKPFYEL